MYQLNQNFSVLISVRGDSPIEIISRRRSAAAQANTRSLPRSRLLILTGIHQLPEMSEFGKEREKGTKEGRETERVLAFSGGGGGEEEPKICAYKLQTAATKMQLLSVHSFVTTRALLPFLRCVGVIRALISLPPSKRQTEFHTLCHRKECSNRGEREGKHCRISRAERD